jgi:hypothetical protein
VVRLKGPIREGNLLAALLVTKGRRTKQTRAALLLLDEASCKLTSTLPLLPLTLTGDYAA